MTARRMDLLVEVTDVLATGGEYVSDWIDSADVPAVRAAWTIGGGGGTFKIEESIDGSTVFQTPLSSSTTNSRTDVPVPVISRLFRVHIASGTAGGAFSVVVRAA